MRPMIGRASVALTGGPCGGKSTLLGELRRAPEFAGKFVAICQDWFPFYGISMREPVFQRLVVLTQAATEEAVNETLGPGDARPLLTHRGTLDPLAYWLHQGWPEHGFYTMTGTTRDEHYRRYAAVLHLVTAADGAAFAYRRYPDNPRGETPEEAVELDELLGKAWGGHPGYVRIGNEGRDWNVKAEKVKDVLRGLLSL